jgi:thioester reductase-like protein
MVDPDNEERLLKIPPRVVAEIKAESLNAAVQRVEALHERYLFGKREYAALIAAIKGDKQ